METAAYDGRRIRYFYNHTVYMVKHGYKKKVKRRTITGRIRKTSKRNWMKTRTKKRRTGKNTKKGGGPKKKTKKNTHRQTDSTHVVSLVIPGGQDFVHGDDYKRIIVKYADPASLMSLRDIDHAWQIVVDKQIDALVKGGTLMVHGGNDISLDKARTLREKRHMVTDVVFLPGTTKIGTHAFDECWNVKSIIIPEGIESIGKSAFFNCTSLVNVTFPKSLKSIGEGTFSHCTFIEAMDFSHTNLTSIDKEAFYHCKRMVSMKLPLSVKSVGKNAFQIVPPYATVLIPTTIDDTDNDRIIEFLHTPQAERDALMLANPPFCEESEEEEEEYDY